MSGVNSVVLVGRLARDVEVRKTASGVSYARFTVACDRRYSGSAQNSAQPQQPTADFISCVAWRQRADYLGSYGRKGTMISVEGSIQTGSYTDRDGRKVYTTDVAADQVSILSPRNSTSQSSSYSQPEPQEPYPAPSASVSTDGFDTGAAAYDIVSDDLPF
jgi:single-strand DNA-binding protein